MTIPDKCWLVTAGGYSDYKVLAVCATKESAEAWLDAYKARIIEERRERWEKHASRAWRTLEEWVENVWGPWFIDEWDVTP